jgi:hypothetical protein
MERWQSTPHSGQHASQRHQSKYESENKPNDAFHDAFTFLVFEDLLYPSPHGRGTPRARPARSNLCPIWVGHDVASDPPVAILR